jgi:hypothetical protein
MTSFENIRRFIASCADCVNPEWGKPKGGLIDFLRLIHVSYYGERAGDDKAEQPHTEKAQENNQSPWVHLNPGEIGLMNRQRLAGRPHRAIL